jgi:phasin family protein
VQQKYQTASQSLGSKHLQQQAPAIPDILNRSPYLAGDSMNNVPEHLVATNKENLETAIAFAGITAAGAEKLIELQLRTAKNVFADAVKSAKALVAIKDVQELTEIQASIAQPLADKITNYGRSVYAVIAETQAEMNKFFEARIAETNKSFVTVLDQAVKNAPPGSDVAVAAVKSAMAAANQAYDAFSRATKQVAEATEATMTAATHTVATKKKAA